VEILLQRYSTISCRGDTIIESVEELAYENLSKPLLALRGMGTAQIAGQALALIY
jgi:hypothetical protein